jgi:predicted PurR-regulated permease PerM
MDIVYFTIIAIGIYFAADRILDFIERKRGARFENRQVAFFAIILPIALITFWVVRALQQGGAGIP